MLSEPTEVYLNERKVARSFDELGEMSVNLQPKFLRALSGEIRRVGERTIKIDARVVSATNRNLLSMVEEVPSGKISIIDWPK